MEIDQKISAAERFVVYALSIKALELVPQGRRLNSGRNSPYFFNSKLICTGTPLINLARAYQVAVISKPEIFFPQVVYGSAYSGIPIATALSIAYASIGVEVGYAFNRKEEKDHGEGGIVVGAPMKGENVLLVDDVMTTGTSFREAVDIVRAQGGTIIGCTIAFDREERGQENGLSAVQEFEKKYHIPVFSVATLTDLISVLNLMLRPENHENGIEMRFTPGYLTIALSAIMEYRDKYGNEKEH